MRCSVHVMTRQAGSPCVSLQCCRQIIQLESQVAALQEDLAAAGKGKRVDKSEALPREPAKLTLHGHRMPVTKVALDACALCCACARALATPETRDFMQAVCCVGVVHRNPALTLGSLCV